MARFARIVIPGIPHHVTQRGNRRQDTFLREGDYQAYLDLMAEWCRKCGVEVWAWCLMPNHVHLIAVPQAEESLARAIGEAHRRYTRLINFREDWRGHLWQARFASFPMDEPHLLAAARTIEMSPVCAGLAKKPEDYQWSSARAHLGLGDDPLTVTRPLLEIAGDWRLFLAGSDPQGEDALLRHERTGRPLGGEEFLVALEKRLDRTLRPQRPGRKRREQG